MQTAVIRHLFSKADLNGLLCVFLHQLITCFVNSVRFSPQNIEYHTISGMLTKINNMQPSAVDLSEC